MQIQIGQLGALPEEVFSLYQYFQYVSILLFLAPSTIGPVYIFYMYIHIHPLTVYVYLFFYFSYLKFCKIISCTVQYLLCKNYV